MKQDLDGLLTDWIIIIHNHKRDMRRSIEMKRNHREEEISSYVEFVLRATPISSRRILCTLSTSDVRRVTNDTPIEKHFDGTSPCRRNPTKDSVESIHQKHLTRTACG